MNKKSSQQKYVMAFIMLIAMSLILLSAYVRNVKEEQEYTRTTRHMVVNAYELHLMMLSFQQKYHSYILGNPRLTQQHVQDAYDIVKSKYDILMEGETYERLSKIKGVPEALKQSFSLFLQISPYIKNALPHDGHLTIVDNIIEHSLLDQVQHIVKKTRIGTNWKSAGWEEATQDSRQLIRISILGILLIFATLIGLLIWQIRATHKALVHAEQSKVTKAKLMAVAGHELRQPLQASSLLLSTLQAQAQSPSNHRLFQGIHHSIESITELLNGILDISRLDADLLTVNKEAVPLTPLLNKMLDRFAEQARTKNLKLTLANPEYLYINSDELLLERIVSNLLSNAICYTQSGLVQLSVTSHQQTVTLSIKDTGPGISKEDQEVIFNEFIQLDNATPDNQQGLGLGLSIVKRLCTLLSHKLTLHSTLGEGSQFDISLPRANTPRVDLPTAPRAQWSLSGVTVVVIEDDQDILTSFDLLLATWGCHVITASTMEQATMAAHQLKVTHENTPHELLIVSDYYLKQSYNGCDVVNTVQKMIGFKVPAMIITAETDPQRLEEIRLTGHSVFRKPLKPATLRIALQRLLKQA